MKGSTRKALFMIMSVLLLATLACGSANNTADDGSLGSEVVTEAPVEAPEMVEETVAVPDSPWYLDEFDGGLDNWSEIYFTKEDEAVYDEETDVYIDEGGLRFDINIESTYIYLFNDLYEYEDVQIEVEAESLGRNTNYISLACRYDEDMGWYEFNIAASGLVSILRYDNEDGYVLIGEGGSEAIHQGTDTNNFIARCKGDRLTLIINGDEWRTFTDKTLKRGLIGVSAGSENVTPVKIKFNWMEITEP
jgi:hypothetical protein